MHYVAALWDVAMHKPNLHPLCFQKSPRPNQGLPCCQVILSKCHSQLEVDWPITADPFRFSCWEPLHELLQCQHVQEPSFPLHWAGLQPLGCRVVEPPGVGKWPIPQVRRIKDTTSFNQRHPVRALSLVTP